MGSTQNTSTQSVARRQGLHRSTIGSTQNTSTQSVARRQDYTGALSTLHRTLQRRVQQEDRITPEHYWLYTEHFSAECSKKTGLHRSTIDSTQNTSAQSVARRQDYTRALSALHRTLQHRVQQEDRITPEHYRLYTEHFNTECSKKTGLHRSTIGSTQNTSAQGVARRQDYTGALSTLHRTLQRRVQQEDRITLEHRSTIASTQNTSTPRVARRQDYTGAQEHYCLYTEHFNTECSKKT